LTAKGVKPVCTVQQVFKSTYLFGAFSPITGDSFLLELPNCCTETFQVFLEELSQQDPDELKLLVLDNGAFHKAKALIIPDNISLIFLPPYSPELNPAEKMWQKIKRDFTNKFFNSLDELSLFIIEAVGALNSHLVKSTCGYSYVFSDTIWTTLYSDLV
jgi:transposase